MNDIKPPPMSIDKFDDTKLLKQVENMKKDNCEFCNKALDQSTGSYIVNLKGNVKTACKSCYFEEVGSESGN